MPRGAFSGGILTVPRQTVYNIICRIKTSGQIEQRSRAQAVRETTLLQVAKATKCFRGFWAFFILFATAYRGTQTRFKTLSY